MDSPWKMCGSLVGCCVQMDLRYYYAQQVGDLTYLACGDIEDRRVKWIDILVCPRWGGNILDNNVDCYVSHYMV